MNLIEAINQLSADNAKAVSLKAELSEITARARKLEQSILRQVKADYRELIKSLIGIDSAVIVQDAFGIETGTVKAVRRERATVVIKGKAWDVCLSSMWPNRAAQLPASVSQRIDDKTCVRVGESFVLGPRIEVLPDEVPA